MRLFLEDGRKKDEYIPEEPMDNIAYCKQTNQFVGWMKDEEEVFVGYLAVDEFFLSHSFPL